MSPRLLTDRNAKPCRLTPAARRWLGLGKGYSDWGYAKNVKWNTYGAMVTVTYYFQGLTETVQIYPKGKNGSGISTNGYETYANGGGRYLALETYHRYGS
ncbi:MULTISPECIES: hypothetical protein [Pseudofrankia]|uniref:hypothetical protein n=1 Tax=Pseudofrankia TaxID=2994363 RepID=UPI000234B6EF|nr:MULTISPECIES: hypothetical protein [Pseudofrankia]OHV32967.1 hypothetical protein BCD49_27940 [Pseudofrankia sp. EUN1h]